MVKVDLTSGGIVQCTTKDSRFKSFESASSRMNDNLSIMETIRISKDKDMKIGGVAGIINNLESAAQFLEGIDDSGKKKITRLVSDIMSKQDVSDDRLKKITKRLQTITGELRERQSDSLFECLTG